jgi:WD40 repeat protein
MHGVLFRLFARYRYPVVFLGCALVPSGHLLAQVVVPRATIQGHTGIVTSIAFSPNGQMLASGGAADGSGARDSTVRLWRSLSGEKLDVLEAPGDNVRCVAFSPDGRWLAAGGDFARVKVWDVSDPMNNRLFPKQRVILWALAFSPDSKSVAAGGGLKVFDLFDVASGEIASSPPGHAKMGIRALSYSPDGRFLLSAGMDNTVKLWDVAKKASLADRDADHKFGIASLTISPEGKWIATGAANKPRKGTSRPDGDIIIWDFKSGEKAATLAGHTSEVTSLAFHRDGKKLASASEDGTVRIWNIDARKESAILRDHKGPVLAVAFSPDGKTMATGGDDKTIRLWDVK